MDEENIESAETNPIVTARDQLVSARGIIDKARHEAAHGDGAREYALAITKIEEALLWLKQAGHAGQWIS